MPLETGFLCGISGKIGSGKDTFVALLGLAMHCQRTGHAPVPENMNTGNAKMIYKEEGIEIHKFADALKDMVCRLTGCTREQLEDQDFKNSVMPEQWDYPAEFDKENSAMASRTYRQFLQELGTNVLRNWIPNIHVNATFATWKPVPVPVKDTRFKNWGGKVGELKAETEQWPKWIITDMRFPNEAQAVKERGGILLRINRYPKTTLTYHTAEFGGREIDFDPNNPQHMDLWKAECLRQHPSENSLDDYQQWDAVIDNNGTIEELYQQAIKIVKQFKLT